MRHYPETANLRYLAPPAVVVAVALGTVAGVAGLVIYWVTAFQYTGDALTAMRELESAPNPQESG